MDNIVVNIRKIEGELCCVDSICQGDAVICESDKVIGRIDLGTFYKVQDNINNGIMITYDNQGKVLSEYKAVMWVEPKGKGYVLNYEKCEEQYK